MTQSVGQDDLRRIRHNEYVEVIRKDTGGMGRSARAIGGAGAIGIKLFAVMLFAVMSTLVRFVGESVAVGLQGQAAVFLEGRQEVRRPPGIGTDGGAAEGAPAQPIHDENGPAAGRNPRPPASAAGKAS
jgi:hypothetical protein